MFKNIINPLIKIPGFYLGEGKSVSEAEKKANAAAQDVDDDSDDEFHDCTEDFALHGDVGDEDLIDSITRPLAYPDCDDDSISQLLAYPEYDESDHGGFKTTHRDDAEVNRLSQSKELHEIQGILTYDQSSKEIKVDHLSTLFHKLKGYVMGKEYFDKQVNDSMRQALSNLTRDAAGRVCRYDHDCVTDKHYQASSDYAFFQKQSIQAIANKLEESYLRELQYSHPGSVEVDKYNRAQKLKSCLEGLNAAVDKMDDAQHFAYLTQSTYHQAIMRVLGDEVEAANYADREYKEQITPEIKKIRIVDDSDIHNPFGILGSDLRQPKYVIKELLRLCPDVTDMGENDVRFMYLLGKMLLFADSLKEKKGLKGIMKLTDVDIQSIINEANDARQKCSWENLYNKYAAKIKAMGMQPARIKYSDKHNRAFVLRPDGSRIIHSIRTQEDFDLLTVYADKAINEPDVFLPGCNIPHKVLKVTQRNVEEVFDRINKHSVLTDTYSEEFIKKVYHEHRENFGIDESTEIGKVVGNNELWTAVNFTCNRIASLQEGKMREIADSIKHRIATRAVSRDPRLTNLMVKNRLSSSSGLLFDMMVYYINYPQRGRMKAGINLREYARISCETMTTQSILNYMHHTANQSMAFMLLLRKKCPPLFRVLLLHMDGKLSGVDLDKQIYHISKSVQREHSAEKAIDKAAKHVASSTERVLQQGIKEFDQSIASFHKPAPGSLQGLQQRRRLEPHERAPESLRERAEAAESNARREAEESSAKRDAFDDFDHYHKKAASYTPASAARWMGLDDDEEPRRDPVRHEATGTGAPTGMGAPAGPGDIGIEIPTGASNFKLSEGFELPKIVEMPDMDEILKYKGSPRSGAKGKSQLEKPASGRTPPSLFRK